LKSTKKTDPNPIYRARQLTRDAIAYPTYLPGKQMSSPNRKNALWRAEQAL